jgi:hypothetical protein
MATDCIQCRGAALPLLGMSITKLHLDVWLDIPRFNQASQEVV